MCVYLCFLFVFSILIFGEHPNESGQFLVDMCTHMRGRVDKQIDRKNVFELLCVIWFSRSILLIFVDRCYQSVNWLTEIKYAMNHLV